ncbi:hypothetical protein ACFY2R_01965 [Micromonospora olivasterospora]|uniref:Uncharacterized protein n=1 Tax=Micromonospora olivasterospora TaxID=1880 RepID=A0A562ICW1_MICOL|nr:hypothetical protein [Micromonospora olivasterospora]TWH68553.1 hypothetical protein JD77_03548 [Micromonospora olivasterospora]
MLAERHRRATHRLYRARTLTAALWPELAPTPPEAEPVRSDGTALRPAIPSARPGD